jgi:serine/threonine-protein kinase
MVIRRRDGTEHAKVLDFGLAKLRERDEAAAVNSGAQILGTPYYMAPEQVRGEVLDPRADLYSLGATLYRVLTGTPPFQAPSPMGVLTKHLTEEPVPPCRRAPERALPPDADRIVLRAMAKSVEDRYGSASEVQRDLERALAAVAAGATEPSAAAALGAPATAGPRSDTRTVAIEESDLVEVIDAGDGGERLRRQDIDAFERSLRVRRVLTRVVLPVLILGAIGGVAYALTRLSAEKPATVEREPNNTAGYANLLPLGMPVRGAIGARIEGGHADIDYFRIPPGHGPRVATVRLQGVPDLDLVLELYDAQGRRLAKCDAYGRGWGEWLQPTSIGPAEVYLVVREEWDQGQPPSERPGDPYALTATWGPPQPGWEVEPNDWEAVATPVPAGPPVRGYLGEEDDRDRFAVTTAASGKMVVRVTPPAGVDVMLLESGAGDDAGKLDGKRMLNRRGPGTAEELTVEAKAGRAVLVGVARKGPLKPEARHKDPKEQAPPSGLDEPYELRATFE